MSQAAASIRPSHTPGRSLAELAEHLDARLVRGRQVPQRRALLPTAPVTGVALDHRSVHPGDLFAALPGARNHGARFAAVAAEAGAIAFLTDEAGADECIEAGCPTLVVPDVRAVLAQVGVFIYARPADALSSFAVTGTNGKTTTTYLLAGLLRRLGLTTGLIGTVEIRIGDLAVPAALTTPEAPDLQAILATMVEQEVGALVMEVSSHALTMNRIDEIVFDVAGFTNLSRDHLDFHGDMDAYLAAKAALFTPERSRVAVITIDDEAGKRIAAEASVPVLRLSTQGEDAEWRVTQSRPHGLGTAFTLAGPHEEHEVHVALPGDFNVANAALAVAMASTAGLALPRELSLDSIVPGRMEAISAQPRVIVDFAHNAEALSAALAALRPTTSGRLAVVFGATGDRDSTKRPAMAQAAAAGADLIYLTDDDPHSEDPAAIRSEMAHVLAELGAEFAEVAPRADAIAAAISDAQAADTVLIAGRGHERIQEVGSVDVLLDDRDEARRVLATWSPA